MKLILAVITCFLALPTSVFASAYSQPYTASFGTSRTGLASSVQFLVFDATGTLRVGPATYNNSSGTSTAGPSNEPAITESSDYTGTGGTGTYFCVLPLDTSWGPLHVKAIITGQAGVAAEGSLVNRGSDVADGYTAALPGTLSTGATNAGTAATNTSTLLTGQSTITAKTNLIATNAADSPNAVTAQSQVAALPTATAAAVWNALTTNYTLTGSFGLYVQSIHSGGGGSQPQRN